MTVGERAQVVSRAAFEQRKTSERLTDLRIWIDESLQKDGIEPVTKSFDSTKKSASMSKKKQSKS
mgnify:CR=1 FL=1